jgi:polyhydroxybutyrate depolymerase
MSSSRKFHARVPFPRRWWRLALGAGVAVSVGACSLGGREHPASFVPAPGTARYSIRVGALSRTFLLHVPRERLRRFGVPVGFPLVIVLHGSGADAGTIRRMSGLDSLSEMARFLVAYPNATTGALGLKSDWNAGECCGAAANRDVDDVGFMHALIGSIAARLPVDRRRVYVAGFSDGARMTYRAGCDLSTELAAIAVVAGSLMDAHCAPTRAVPLIAFHGTADDEVPYFDSALTAPRLPPPAAWAKFPPSIQFWAAADGCHEAAITHVAPHVVLTRFGHCAADVVLYTVQDGLHAWPGGQADGDEPTHELSASRELWNFFVHHRKR